MLQSVTEKESQEQLFAQGHAEGKRNDELTHWCSLFLSQLTSSYFVCQLQTW